MNNILIIGNGYVGQHMRKYFPTADVVDHKGFVGKRKFKHYRVAFVCVPTPMFDDGSCDIEQVRKSMETYRKDVDIFCIRSTVSVGTTDFLDGLGFSVCFQPEYIGEKTSKNDTPDRTGFIILGGQKWITRELASIWVHVTLPQMRIFQTNARTAELCKLFDNAWIATKVTFFNSMFEVAHEAKVDFHELREALLLDERIGRSHTYVYDNERGFGGQCIPKDVNNLAASFQSTHLFEFILGLNVLFRDRPKEKLFHMKRPFQIKLEVE